MVDKLHEYEGFAGRVHDVRDKFKEKWEAWKEWKNGIPMDQGIEGILNHIRGPPKLERTLDDYAHIYRYIAFMGNVKVQEYGKIHKIRSKL